MLVGAAAQPQGAPSAAAPRARRLHGSAGHAPKGTALEHVGPSAGMTRSFVGDKGSASGLRIAVLDAGEGPAPGCQAAV